MTLFKYLPREYLSSVLTEGSFLFRSLSYFQDYEDDLVRGDKYDGVLRHEKDSGLELNNLTTGKSFKVPWQFMSKVDAENIFIFCTSTKLCPMLAKEFKADACIEFVKPVQIISKLRGAVKRRKRIKPNRLFHRCVDYYNQEDAPKIKWAFPEKIVMRKLDVFSSQEEYRFMFSLEHAISFGKTCQELQVGEGMQSKRLLPYPEHKLKIGNIKRWCKVHEFI